MAVKDWKDFYFESTSYRTPEYIKFERECKKELKAICKNNNIELIKFSPMHFEWSACVKHNKCYIYISFRDVRGWNWFDSVLVRYVKNEKDYHGEANHFCSWDKLEEYLLKMFKEREDG